MTMTKSSLPLQLRPATLGDRDPLMAWCNRLWDGEEDYIGDVWADWVAEGNLFVGTHPEFSEPVALLRLRMLTPAEAWFGGLRIHPQLQGQGIGRALIAMAQQWASERGAQSIGYMTETKNQRMHYLGQQLGYTQLGTITICNVQTAPALAALASQPQIDLQLDTTLQSIQHGRYIYDWTMLRLTPQRIAHHAAANELLALADGQGWAIYSVDHEHTEGCVHQLAGDMAAQQRLLAHIRASYPAYHLIIPVWAGQAALDQPERLGIQPQTGSEHYSLFERQL